MFTHAVGSPLTAQGALSPHPLFLIHFPTYNIYSPEGREKARHAVGSIFSELLREPWWAVS